MYTVIVVLVDAVHTYPCIDEDDASTLYRQQLSFYALVSPVTILKVKVCNDGLAVLKSVILDGNT